MQQHLQLQQVPMSHPQALGIISDSAATCYQAALAEAGGQQVEHHAGEHEPARVHAAGPCRIILKPTMRS